ncbi:FAD-binding protein [Treponema sp.]|uniref:L-aspartate oxidase n=1 Tax=Treponema sp. TaxID=166 RepID=UPI00257F1D9E|nr:FAD-binding protein [Treponema sp.]MBE6355087.1 FAD-binding protein [Treponema sp.]
MNDSENKFFTDVLIVGSGVAGLYCALKLPENLNVTVISKEALEDCDSYLAQGGICMLKNDEDYDSYFEDTMRAGHYLNNKESVDIMIRSSQHVIKDLIGYGVDFERNEDGSLKFTREGAHSTPRILFHEDITGKEITSRLLEEVKKHSNIHLYNHVTMTDIIEQKITVKNNQPSRRCAGIIASVAADSPLAGYAEAEADDGSMIVPMYAENVVWACGGIGGLYEHSTNYPHLTGDALGIALNHEVELLDPDYIQIHPTTLYSTAKGRSFLISESVRGEGGILLNKDKKRFVNELLPRDVVANAILEQMKKDGTPHVWLSMENIKESEIKTHFCHIYQECLKNGYDCTKEPIPVVPAQHYFMGGVKVDRWSKTNLSCLYACGETSCNGVHGKNRLASNSLLESLVFAARAAAHMVEESKEKKYSSAEIVKVDYKKYKDLHSLFGMYREKILDAIERSRENHERNNNDAECRQSDSASA